MTGDEVHPPSVSRGSRFNKQGCGVDRVSDRKVASLILEVRLWYVLEVDVTAIIRHRGIVPFCASLPQAGYGVICLTPFRPERRFVCLTQTEPRNSNPSVIPECVKSKSMDHPALSADHYKRGRQLTSYRVIPTNRLLSPF